MTAIEFEHVSKQYRLGLVSTKTLSHDIRRFWITNVLHKEDPYPGEVHNNDSDLGASWHPNYTGHLKKAYTLIPVISTLTGWPMETKPVE